MATLPLSFPSQVFPFLNCETIKPTKLIATSQFHFQNARRMGSLLSINAALGEGSTPFSAYQFGTQLYTSADLEELENASSYLFRTDIGGQVKVYVGKKHMKFMVCIEVSSLPSWISQKELTLHWGLYVSDSSSLTPLKSQNLPSGTGSTNSLELEFESDLAPFYLSFSLQCPSDSIESDIEIRTHRKTNFCVPVGACSGYPAPLGISFSDDESVNFALVSRNAQNVVLCLHSEMAGKPSLEIDLDPYINRTGDVWHISLESVAPYTSYSYRCHGSEIDTVIHESRVLLDPYARFVKRYSSDPLGLVRYAGSLVQEPKFDWSGEVTPCLPMEKLVVYRLNVECFTKDKSSELTADLAGTFYGLIEKMHHFKKLGVNAILLEPIFSFDKQKGPYFPYHFFSPMSSYGPTHDDGLSARTSMKEMVKCMHANHIEVLLEVVFTRTVGLQGIDDQSYYVVDDGVELKDERFLNCNYPVVQRIILDSLRHWVTEFHIDGFCFMNSSSLLRGPSGEYLSRPPLIEAIAFDPLLSKAKVISDSFDPYYLVSKEIQFPHWKRWAEMNTKFCSDVRNFLRGEGLLSGLATRLCGSADIFLDGRGPSFAFNFVARNFGLPLVDLVSFSSSELLKELSWNCGEEGPTNRSVILQTRLKQIRNYIFILYISMGVPVFNMGDECGHSSGGSPSYSQRRSFDWDTLSTSFGVQMTEFITFLSSLRTRRGDLFQRRTFMRVENVDWHGSDQALPKWEDPTSMFLAMTLKADIDESDPSSKQSCYGGDMFLAFNSSDCSETVLLSPPSQGMAWFRLVDTALPFPGFFLTDGTPLVEETPGLLAYEMKSHSCTLFEAQRPVD